MFTRYRIYRHENPACTFDIQIIKIQFRGPNYIKMKIEYVSRLSQQSYGFDKVTIRREDYVSWRLLK